MAAKMLSTMLRYREADAGRSPIPVANPAPGYSEVQHEDDMSPPPSYSDFQHGVEKSTMDYQEKMESPRLAIESLQPYVPTRTRERRRRRVGIACIAILLFELFCGATYHAGPIYNKYYANILLHAGLLNPAEKAEIVLKANPLIDGHNDLLILLRMLYGNQIYSTEFPTLFENGGLPGHVDIPRLEAGLVGGAFWSAFVPCPANVSDYSDANYGASVRATLDQIDLFHRLSAQYPTQFTLSPNAAAAEKAFLSGRLISPLAIEGLHQIGNSVANLRLYHQLGVRYATLTWNCHNIYADAALISSSEDDLSVAKPLWGGVSPAGRKLVEEMNRLGMLVDLSHVSVDTMRDVLGGSPEKGWEGSIAPPIFSHSSAKALCPHPRNVPDDILQLVKKKNGLVMVNFAPDFVSCKAGNSSSGLPEFVEETNTLDHVVEHILHIGNLIGFAHVGLGTDYDGIPNTPRGLEDVSKFPDLVAELIRRGVSMDDAGKVVGRNLLRVWKQVDEVAKKLQKERLPLEDELDLSEMGVFA